MPCIVHAHLRCFCLPTGPLLYWRPAGVLVAFPVVAYGFTTHHFLFTIYSSLKSPNVKRMTLVGQKVRPLRPPAELLLGGMHELQ